MRTMTVGPERTENGAASMYPRPVRSRLSGYALIAGTLLPAYPLLTSVAGFEVRITSEISHFRGVNAHGSGDRLIG